MCSKINCRDQKGFICVGAGQCANGKGCQQMVEEELLKLQKAESADGTKLLEIEHKIGRGQSSTVDTKCDAKCVAELRALVQSQAEELKSLRSK